MKTSVSRLAGAALRSRLLTATATLVALALSTPPGAEAAYIEYATPAGATQGGLPVSAQVDITTGNGTITITLENNVLRLSGERKFERDAKKESFQRIERTYGAFSRAFALPQQVNSAGVQASFENGVLTISVPKAEQAKPRKIEIS